MTKSSASLRDVAQAAGVSLTTASRVLNNKSNVSPAAREQVLKAAADLNYRPQIRAVASMSSKFNTIGVVIKRDAYEPTRLDQFYFPVLCGIEDECQRLGISLMYARMHVNEYSQAADIPALFDNADIDGLAIVGIVFDDAALAQRIPTHIPLVVVDASVAGIECDTINTDNVTGAYHAVSHLIARGHTHIGLIGSTLTGPEHPSKRARREGYLKALVDHGIEQQYIEDSMERHASSYHATLQLLQRAPQITAIFACSDTIGRQVIQAVEDSGLRVPDDISLVGFDDTEAAAVARPPITTMHVDKELMGTLAVRQLHDQATNRNRVPISLLMGTKLIERESVIWRNPETT